eukprot:CAMPEP_0113303208 /NCGR_PEP_ID=MMETSP0010_2-20120614/3723_1 /TAXON_ID=216773 ORGANISM="Corethron hystrix, Strain 308" /NCGR_SAMPLE_ID=MMETSP0010_2 /ASSEMBLY_ACC=CAM_ASM_000155 /LENGTH=112 /DNA_ID=CAMNT_0000157173 /DNA_START=62 /DNA_END=397 /DNA_ORIENTATION=- /assembly_acc=CAM_ASM_000155
MSTSIGASSWPFCPDCRSILNVDQTGMIRCLLCKYDSHLTALQSLPITTTKSAPRSVPNWAKSDEEQAASIAMACGPSRATVDEPCPKCGAPEVGYYTLQLRSVDEGQTVFY